MANFSNRNFFSIFIVAILSSQCYTSTSFEDRQLFALDVNSPQPNFFTTLLEMNDFANSYQLEDKCQIRESEANPHFYKFFPQTRAILKKQGDISKYSTNCFSKNMAKLTKLTKKETIIELETSDKSSLLCGEFYLIATSNILVTRIPYLSMKREIVLSNLTEDDLQEIKINGIRVMSFCKSFYQSLVSIVETLKMWIGGFGSEPSWNPFASSKIPEYMENANLKFLNDNMDLKLKKRQNLKTLEIDEKKIKSGDFIAISRQDGLDEMIMLGTGSTVGHTAVAGWIDNELYIFESQDGWYWPHKGIQKNKFKDWIKYAENADFMVTILPLREEYRKKFNMEKTIEDFWRITEGLPYGHHNFIFGWIDTPTKNIPKILDPYILLPAFSIFNRVAPAASKSFLVEALNMRLGTAGLSLSQAVAKAAYKNMSFEELLAVVEKEGWEYSDGRSYVCSCFVVGFWKAGGLFDDLQIESTEFIPRDIIQLNIFDEDSELLRHCREKDPSLNKFCQIMGKYELKFPKHNTIKPYDRMNEKCESQPPLYERTEGC